jgi:hypothetical protein
MPTAPKTHKQRLREAQGRSWRDKAYDKTVRLVDPGLRRAKQIRNSIRYQRFRKWFKAKWLTCCDPLNWHPETVEATAECHHIKGLRYRPDLAYSEEWCAPLCSLCHGKVHGMQRSGKPTEHLFESFRQKVLEQQGERS